MSKVETILESAEIRAYAESFYPRLTIDEAVIRLTEFREDTEHTTDEDILEDFEVYAISSYHETARYQACLQIIKAEIASRMK